MGFIFVSSMFNFKALGQSKMSDISKVYPKLFIKMTVQISNHMTSNHDAVAIQIKS